MKLFRTTNIDILSVCLSVRLPQACTVPKRLNVGSHKQRRMDSSFLTP